MSAEDILVSRTLAAWLDTHRPCVLATVIRGVGSVPRHPGAKMVIALDGETAGTVGGGTVERKVIDEARRLLATDEPASVVAFDLTEESACGGRMEVFLEPHRAGKRIVIIGAGHVCAAVAPLLVRLSWDVTLIDPRADRLELPEYRLCRKVRATFDEAPRHIAFTPDLFILVMTPDHAFDTEIAAGCLEQPWKWLGVMGSARKADQIKAALAARGLSPERIARLRVPVGIEIGSDTPEEIAVSIAAELISATSAKRPGPASPASA
jgi:xanthine dehydrogenase accessory factor